MFTMQLDRFLWHAYHVYASHHWHGAGRLHYWAANIATLTERQFNRAHHWAVRHGFRYHP